MMTQTYAQVRKLLRPIILAGFVLTSAPVFVVFDQSFPETVPVVVVVAPEVHAPVRTTIVYKGS